MEVYEQYCASNNVPGDDSIKKALVKATISGELVLSGISLSAVSSAAIGSVISRLKNILKLDISDCLLPATSLSLLLQKLTNSQLVGLNLKGNNIFGEGLDALSRFLMKNRSLKILKLEWNNLGASVDGFSQLCHALTSNSILEILDLRNNELNSECGFELFDAITRNSSLKELDLRWNNLGSEGGQSLLSALRSNKYLIDVKVQGNSIPAEIVAAIESSVDHNRVARRIQHEYTQRSQALSEQIAHIEQQRTHDMKTLSQQNATQIKSALDQLTEKNRLVCELEMELQDSQMIVSQLEAQLNALSSELFVKREKVEMQEEMIKKLEKEVKSCKEEAESDLEGYKKIGKLCDPESSVDHNRVARRIQHEYTQRSQALSEQIAHIEQQRTLDMKTLAQQNATQIKSALDQLTEKNRLVCELEVELQDSQMIVSQLEAQLNALSSELFVKREKVEMQEEIIKKLEKEVKSCKEEAEGDLEGYKKKLNDKERDSVIGLKSSKPKLLQRRNQGKESKYN
ncbi:leucine-rich repeat-containing protein 45-like [Nilaparvata lugens]|uniref:leucine-rich repeat-containing protein 45-like n=1 Tax=Nilaparvata lugens TaxID=108931 RepID=UPI00193D0A75|nr:leucine-rich repeat-containing protein 45-like [Nilaparvata lugens]